MQSNGECIDKIMLYLSSRKWYLIPENCNLITIFVFQVVHWQKASQTDILNSKTLSGNLKNAYQSQQ
jgi:hypothetical protein